MTRRVYETGADGRRSLLHRPGDLVSDEEAERIGGLAEEEPEKPAWMRVMARQHEAPAAPPPTKSLSRMTLAELEAVCAAEGIDPGEANLRAEYVQAIEAGRAAAGTDVTRK